MRYEVDAGGHRVRIEASPDGRMLVDGRVVAYDAREIVAGRHWSLVIEGRAHEVVVLGGEPPTLLGGPARMRVDGREAVVIASDERTLAARRDRALAGGGRHEIRAPMPGLLKAVHVREGDVVERNDALATLEAMKMENELRAPARSKVQRLAATAGAKIESGSLIAVLVDEPA
ncbi:MAG: biotin/lipoyl-binding protein [Chloroflexi bacterium]|nr:biotin/lipoyl-binding protein [Chloroflexota bacterium]